MEINHIALNTADSLFYILTVSSLLSIQIILAMINKNLKNLSTMVISTTGHLHRVFATEQSKRSEILLRKIQLVEHENESRINYLWPLQFHFYKIVGVENNNYYHFRYLDDDIKRLWLTVVFSIFSKDFITKSSTEVSVENIHKCFMKGNGESDLHPLIFKEIVRISSSSDKAGVLGWIREELQCINTVLVTDKYFKHRVDRIVNTLLSSQDQWLYCLPIGSADEVSEWESFITANTGKAFSLKQLPGISY